MYVVSPYERKQYVRGALTKDYLKRLKWNMLNKRLVTAYKRNECKREPIIPSI